jgi:hypothetical protein
MEISGIIFIGVKTLRATSLYIYKESEDIFIVTDIFNTFAKNK